MSTILKPYIFPSEEVLNKVSQSIKEAEATDDRVFNIKESDLKEMITEIIINTQRDFIRRSDLKVEVERILQEMVTANIPKAIDDVKPIETIKGESNVKKIEIPSEEKGNNLQQSDTDSKTVEQSIPTVTKYCESTKNAAIKRTIPVNRPRTISVPRRSS